MDAAITVDEAPPRRGPGRPTLSNEALLDKALDIFLEKGFERTTIDAITAAAGVAKRTVYQRYGDKLALFKAALLRAVEEWALPIETLRALENDDLEETLLRLGETLVNNVMTPAGLRLLRITNAESGRMPEIGVFTYSHGTGRTIDYLADLFQRRIGPGGLAQADANLAAVAFLYLVVGGPPSMTAWGISYEYADVQRFTRFSVRLFLKGLTPREEALAGEPARAPDAVADLEALREENRRLRRLLVESMLEAEILKERFSCG